MMKGNLFDNALPPAEGERFETLLSHHNLQIERIVSAESSTPGTVYVQTQDEWVLLLHGQATMLIDGAHTELKAGDHLFLPQGLAHSVLSTSQGAMWLAVHLHPAG